MPEAGQVFSLQYLESSQKGIFLYPALSFYSACSKRMFLELYGKPLNLCRRQDRCFPCSIWKALKKEYSCIQPCDSICSVCFRHYRMLLLQGSCYCYDAARKSELYFPLWHYHNCLLENRN